MNLRLLILALAAIAALSACSRDDAPTSRSSDGSSRSPESTLPARWWLWAESAGSRNPISDETGRDCAVNQPTDVWFLAGTFGGPAIRACTIPTTTPVYFPVMNSICEVRDGDEVQRTLDECDTKPLEMNAELDGNELEIAKATSEGSFEFAAGPESLIASPNSRFQAVAGGEWVGPLKLSDGEHVLHFAARSDSFELDVTYRLKVK